GIVERPRDHRERKPEVALEQGDELPVPVMRGEEEDAAALLIGAADVLESLVVEQPVDVRCAKAVHGEHLERGPSEVAKDGPGGALDLGGGHRGPEGASEILARDGEATSG